MARENPTPDQAKAAGWFKPEVRGGELWAKDVEWTPKGAAALKDREFRHFSPWVLFNKATRHIVRLMNVAITNLPATVGIEPLVASEAVTAPAMGAREDEKMNELFKLLSAETEAEALAIVQGHNEWMQDVLAAVGTTKADETVAAIKKLVEQSAELSSAKETAEAGQLALAERVATLEADASRVAREKVKTELTEAGKLPPSLHEWFMTLSDEQAAKFGEAAPKLTPGNTKPKTPETEGVVLTDEDKAVAKMCGVSLAEFAKQRKAEIDAAKESEEA
jgi:phage I-like protein